MDIDSFFWSYLDNFDQFYSFLNNGQYDEAEDILDEIDQQREYHDKEVAAGRVKLKLERIRGGKKWSL